MIIFFIALLSFLSYSTAIRAILRGKYRPNIYSRVIWFLLAINGLAGLIRLNSGDAVIALSALQTLGSLLILIGAFRFSILKFGKVELASSLLLLVSLGVWLLGDYPAINVGISLIAHFIGGIPTILTVTKRPESENIMFWCYFGIASIITLVFADKSNFQSYMFPLYFSLYNALIAGLSARQFSATYSNRDS